VVGEVSRIEDRAVARSGGPPRRVPTTQLR
jgi:hypothetical protein